MCGMVYYKFRYQGLVMAGMHNPRPSPQRSFIRPLVQVKNAKNVSWMTEILGMNLNFIELLTIMQLLQSDTALMATIPNDKQ